MPGRETRVADGDPAAVHAAARAGTAGPAQRLPYFDRIQQLFGHHDISLIGAHVGGAAAQGAAAIGAEAYATGDRIAFAHAPDLRTAAHEAAHFVQQRGGALAGGVGAAGDAHEQHADEVAELVVRGQSAEPLLDRYGAPSTAAPAAPAVQRIITTGAGDVGPGAPPAAFLLVEADGDARKRAFLTARAAEATRTPIATVRAQMAAVMPAPAARAAAPADANRIRKILGEMLAGGNYIFNNPPLESSGDIYHTVGFLAVLRAANLPLPRVVIGYRPDADGAAHPTRTQAVRAQELAAALGFGDRVTTLEVPLVSSDYLTGRLLDTRRAIRENEGLPAHPILDQKTSTAMIAILTQELGRDTITGLIRNQMTTYAAPGAGVQTASDTWQEQQIARIRASVGARRFVLFNERIAENQGQHNAEGEDFAGLRAHIEKQDMAIYTLRSHNQPEPEGGWGDASSPSFAAIADGNQKVQHLQLLSRIKAIFGAQLVGLYGSTSGTTDAAALVGIRTLSLHSFSIDTKKKAKGGLNDQDQRELLMQPFKSVVRRNKDKAPADEFDAWAGGKYGGADFDQDDLKKLANVYTRMHAGGGDKQQELDKDVVEHIHKLLAPFQGPPADLFAGLQTPGGVALHLQRGDATGAGMNCLIHTMVQLDGNAAAAAGERVTAIRNGLIDDGHAALNQMLDPYQAGGAAAMMAEFRGIGHFSTQILQWTGGHMLVHPRVGAGPVRLLLHRMNHFEPVWGNNGLEVDPTAGAAAEAGGEDAQIAAAIRRSLAGDESSSSDSSDSSDEDEAPAPPPRRAPARRGGIKRRGEDADREPADPPARGRGAPRGRGGVRGRGRGRGQARGGGGGPGKAIRLDNGE
ncbi:MAG TPA: DUF4157 domain-containing protein [Kofleriaceae bacterium]